MALDPEQVAGNWVHLHEEDTGDYRVFGRKGVPLPPSRGRAEFSIDEALIAHKRGPGADDRIIGSDAVPVVAAGAAAGAAPSDAIRVAKVTGDRLYVLKR